MTPGQPGDTETITSVNTLAGQAILHGGNVVYTAPAGGLDTVGYSVTDQFGDSAAGTINVTVDPGPNTKSGALTIGHSQTADLTSLINGLVTPGLAGDTETITLTSAQVGQIGLNGGRVVYTAPATGFDIVGYTVTDQFGETATGTINVMVDPGPSTRSGAVTVPHNQLNDLTAFITGLVTPGLPGDTETITSVVAQTGQASVSGGCVSYSNPLSGPDTLGYTVVDQFGGTANGTVNVTVDPGPSTKPGAITLGHNQTADLTDLINGLVTPGLPGDTETLLFAVAGPGQASLTGGHVLYTAPAAGADTIAYAVGDQFSENTGGTIVVTVDPGPTMKPGALTVGHNQVADLTALINGLITPGLAGDIETVIGITAQTGQVDISGSRILYNAPAVGSDVVSFLVGDQFSDTANGTVNVTVDPGPSATHGAITIGHNQVADLTALINGLVMPGLTGDAETIIGVNATAGLASIVNGHVVYSAPAGGLDPVQYIVADQFGDTATGAVSVTVDPGPNVGAATITVAASQTIDLSSYLLGLAAPGLVGDKLSLGGASTIGTHGRVTVANGDLTYTAPPRPSADSFLYSVIDQFGDTASNKVGVTVATNLNNLGSINGTVFAGNANSTIGFGNGNVTLFAGNGTDLVQGGSGKDIVIVGNGNDTIKLNGTPQSVETIIAGSGNDNIIAAEGNGSISAGSGKNTITVGNGDWTIITTGAGATIETGNGQSTITASAGATVTVGKGSDIIITSAASSGLQNKINLGDGADTVYAAPWTTITAGDGADAFWFGVRPGDTANPLGPVTINHFGSRDTINIAAGLGPVTKSVAHGTTTLNFGGNLADTITLAGYAGAVNIHLVA